MSIGLIVTRGFGNGTLIGTIKDVVTAGFDLGAAIIPWPTDIDDATIESKTAKITLISQTANITVRSV